MARLQDPLSEFSLNSVALQLSAVHLFSPCLGQQLLGVDNLGGARTYTCQSLHCPLPTAFPTLLENIFFFLFLFHFCVSLWGRERRGENRGG